jgi:exodeoxyribonuclease-3
MRIATWNVNSLKARLEKVEWWLDRAQPDVVLIQETKVTDEDAPTMAFRMRGYELVHHGEGRWNGVAIASRSPIDGPIVTNFGDGPVRDTGPGAAVSLAEEDFDPFNEARMLSAVVEGIRFVTIYAPNGRVVGSPFYTGKLEWYARLRRWLDETTAPTDLLVIGGDFNIAPAEIDVWDESAVHGATHVSRPERAAFQDLLSWGLVDVYRELRPEPGRYTWWDYRAGNFHKNYGMRIDHLLMTAPVAGRAHAADIDREARKGFPVPSDHAPLIFDLDSDGVALETGWGGAEAKFAARQAADQRSKARKSARPTT